MRGAPARKSILRALAPMVFAAMFPAIAAAMETPAENDRFQAFLREFRAEALDEGITAETYDRAVEGLMPSPRVVALNGNQPEFVRPIWDYLAAAVSERRIAQGREQLAANAGLFGRIEMAQGVPREVLAAIWGMESNYGQARGAFNLFQALATLAYDGRRQQYGRRQLLAALRISQDEGIDPKEMTGSWAGAFGHTQFIPATFLEYAIDGDGDGKRDLWNSAADALASAANYLRRSGWRDGLRWGDEVRLPGGFAYESADTSLRRPRGEWASLGLRPVSGADLDSAEAEAAVYLPAGAGGPAFLINGNFNAILRYNPAASYALAIGVLSDMLAGRPGIIGMWPGEADPLTSAQRITLQEGLTALGYDTGGTDGVISGERNHRVSIDEVYVARIVRR